MPLTFAEVGEEKVIKKVCGNTDIKRHLENLGFVVGGRVKVITVLSGNMIVSVKNVRVAVNRELAQRILI